VRVRVERDPHQLVLILEEEIELGRRKRKEAPNKSWPWSSPIARRFTALIREAQEVWVWSRTAKQNTAEGSMGKPYLWGTGLQREAGEGKKPA